MYYKSWGLLFTEKLYFSCSQWSNVAFGQTQPTALLYYIFLLQLQEDHETPENPKNRQFTVVFQWQQKYDKNFWVELVYFFHTFITCGKTWIILNKYEEWHWFLLQFIFV